MIIIISIIPSFRPSFPHLDASFLPSFPHDSFRPPSCLLPDNNNNNADHDFFLPSFTPVIAAILITITIMI